MAQRNAPPFLVQFLTKFIFPQVARGLTNSDFRFTILQFRLPKSSAGSLFFWGRRF